LQGSPGVCNAEGDISLQDAGIDRLYSNLVGEKTSGQVAEDCLMQGLVYMRGRKDDIAKKF
jgi:hypothetical protein